ncbi:MAG: hypothetical protein IH787_05495 [Nitrospirae bacterium]|nr:hypothetical protein [Nitrospirota bacterium]
MKLGLETLEPHGNGVERVSNLMGDGCCKIPQRREVLSARNLISLVAILAVTTFYSTTGGLRSVVRTDIVQFAIMMVGTLLFATIVVKAAGGNVVNLPGAEIQPALQSGAIDATEWVGPYNDLAFGLYKSAKFYYYPGWQEPATCLDNFINIKKWEALPGDLKALIEAANAAVNHLVLGEFIARNNTALLVLLTPHNVPLRRFSNEILYGLGELAGQVLNDLASRDRLSREVFDSALNFRKDAIAWSKTSEQAYLAARGLPFKYAEPSTG